jgi:hypothetical protein
MFVLSPVVPVAAVIPIVPTVPQIVPFSSLPADAQVQSQVQLSGLLGHWQLHDVPHCPLKQNQFSWSGSISSGLTSKLRMSLRCMQ